MTDQTPALLSLTGSGDSVQPVNPKAEATGYCVDVYPVRWKPYKPEGARQMGRAGRWQRMNDYAGWDNAPVPAVVYADFVDVPALMEATRAPALPADVEAMAQNLEAWAEVREICGQSTPARDLREAAAALRTQAAHIEALQAKIHPETSCACSYDTPEDRCSTSRDLSDRIAALEAERDEAKNAYQNLRDEWMADAVNIDAMQAIVEALETQRDRLRDALTILTDSESGEISRRLALKDARAALAEPASDGEGT